MGSHVIVFSSDPEADRTFFADVLGHPHVDAGGGWLIFKLPPAELAVHPSDGPTGHELYFVCDDVEATMRDLQAKGVDFTQISEERWDGSPASGCPAVATSESTNRAIRSPSTCEQSNHNVLTCVTSPSAGQGVDLTRLRLPDLADDRTAKHAPSLGRVVRLRPTTEVTRG